MLPQGDNIPICQHLKTKYFSHIRRHGFLPINQQLKCRSACISRHLLFINLILASNLLNILAQVSGSVALSLRTDLVSALIPNPLDIKPFGDMRLSFINCKFKENKKLLMSI